MDMATNTKSCLSYPAATTQHKDFANWRLFAQWTCAYAQNKLKSTGVEVFSPHGRVYSKRNRSTKLHTIDVNKTVATEVMNIQATLLPIENA